MSKETEGIVGLAFGIPASIRSNRILSQIVTQAARQMSLPVFIQAHFILVPASLDVTPVRETEDNPLPTLSIGEQAVEWAVRRRISKLWIAAAEPHLWRVLRDFKYAIDEAGASIALQVLPAVTTQPRHIWFCPESGQRFHRTEKTWNRYDRVMKMIPMPVYVFVYTRLRKYYAA